MALVCDIKSNNSPTESPEKQEEIDLEDGEIEDDEEDPNAAAALAEPPKPEEPAQASESPPQDKNNKLPEKEKIDRDKPKERSERVDRRKHEDKGKRHLTEAEKSILHLRKREEAQRKKWEKMRLREADQDDDFAKNIEKTLATILNKKEKEAAAAFSGEDKEIKLDRSKTDREPEEDKRGRKRRKSNRDRKNKQRRVDSPKSDIDETEMLNIRGGSPDRRFDIRKENSPRGTPIASEESCESGDSSDRGRTEDKSRRKDSKKGGKQNRDHGKEKHKNRNRDKKNESQQLKDSPGICVFFLQGKCQKTDCPYSHEAVPPLKLELCKFYLMDCCAKGDKCSYMHSEFPCKFYHTGLNCVQGDDCKFAHGKPLSDGLKQILFKHIETAPRDLLGGFPRVTRDEALDMINATQTQLQDQQGIPTENKEETKGGIPSLFDINVPIPPELLQGNEGKGDKLGRHRQSRWQEPDPLKSFAYGQDQDMRINSNGDIDMRTLPPPPVAKISPTVVPKTTASQNDLDLEKYKREAGLGSPKQDFDIRHTNMIPYSMSKDTDIRNNPLLATKDVDIRHIPPAYMGRSLKSESEDEPMLQIDTGEENQGLPKTLPKTQRDLFMRIQSHQKENVVESENKEGFQMDDNINWYSDDDDDDDNRLTIKVDSEDVKEKEEPAEAMDTSETMTLTPSTMIKPQEVVEKLGDLSKIDISAEVTKLLTSMSQNKQQFPFLAKESNSPSTSTTSTDPRTSRQDPRISQSKESPRADPRASSTSADPRLSTTASKQRSRQSSSESQHKSEKISIYEQGSIDRRASTEEADIDIRSMRSDVDLRSLQLSFKCIQNYTPASEIDSSINSHPPMTWKLVNVEVPRPDYTGLKLSVSDAEKTGDPRLRKIFRLSTEERDTPLSPKASPKAHSTVRVDPRLRKSEESKNDAAVGLLNFNQQLNVLQSSAFYQSLTSNQKVLLNQELSQRRNDHTNSNSHDPVLNSLLSNLNIIPNSNMASNPNSGTALSILANVSKLNNPMLNQPQNNLPMMSQNPGLMNQNINQPGLLGAAPGIPNLPPDFSINFDPRNGGLLGNAPMPFGGFPPPDGQNFNNYNDDYYPPEGGGNFQGNRDNRGFNRDRRRGRNNFNRNNGNRNFRNRNNRANRNHSPP